MNKTLKKTIVIVLIVAGVCGAAWGGLKLYAAGRHKPVQVFPAQSMGMTDYWGDSAESYGMVTTDRIQSVVVSSTQQIKEVYVSEGQTVKIGDPLVTYDTTLTDIDLAKAEITLEKAKMSLENAQKELESLQKMKPHSSKLITPESTGIEYVSEKTPLLVQGTGTQDDPFIYLWGKEDPFSMNALKKMFPQKPEPDPLTEPGEEPENPINYNESYVIMMTRYKDAMNGPVESVNGFHLQKSGGDVNFEFFDASLPAELMKADEEPQPYYKDYGSYYTAAELAEMRSAKEAEIKTLELDVKVAEVDYAKLLQESDNGTIVSKIDGVVKLVRNPDEVMDGETVVEVSDGGGYYINVSMSEMEMGTVQVGQTVTVNSWQSGGVYQGTVVSVSEYPTDSADSYSNGNTNVSYYPFTVFVDESAMLQEYEYVSVTYEKSTQSSGFYLMTQYVRSEGGRNYVFVRDENGLLAERTVQIGKNLWGSYTEIRGGLGREELIAFPYGTDVFVGARTEEVNPNDVVYW